MKESETTKKYKVVGYDSFDHEEFPVGEYATEKEAVDVANARGGTMTLMYVYNMVSGCRVHKAGSF
jgi:hypothetical protein